MAAEIKPGDLVDSTEALIILKYWRPGLPYRPNVKHLKRFFNEGYLTTRIKIKNQYFYDRSEVEKLFIKLIKIETKSHGNKSDTIK